MLSSKTFPMFPSVTNSYRSSWGKLFLSLFSCGTTFALKMDSGKLNILYQALNVNNLSSFSFV
ncbi:hypothetical protein NPIL_483991, partial [Nephila pilipes]